MPEYLAPGVYVEETSFRPKSIAGVSTSTAAFVGMTSRGPMIDEKNPPTLLTSFADFEQIYGGFEEFFIKGKFEPNYMAHAASAFFNNGGGRLYIGRVMGTGATPAECVIKTDIKWLARNGGGGQFARSEANFVVLVQVIAQKLTIENARKLAATTPLTLIRWQHTDAAAVKKTVYRYLEDGKPGSKGLAPNGVTDTVNSDVATADVEALTLNITVSSPSGHTIDFPGLGLHKKHPRFVGTVLGKEPIRKSDIFNNPIFIDEPGEDLSLELAFNLIKDNVSTKEHSQVVAEKAYELVNGSDGTGFAIPEDYKKAFEVLAGHEDISMIAAPGAVAQSGATAVNNVLIAAAEKRRAYRIAVLDAPNESDLNQITAHKSILDSTKAALYYPWIVAPNPLFGDDPLSHEEVELPPSGFVCGVYARTDVNRGVWKPPANEVVFGVNRFSRTVHFGEQELLNPMGVNCLRSMPNRGHRIWGARTTSSDPEWMYVNVRRYFLYLEASIDRGTQWSVFEPNGEKLWFNMRETVKDFLYNEWVNGALLGSTPKEAFFVRCDRTTMTQNDIDNGRLVCLIGVAAIKPAEFVIFRIGQKLTGSNG
jgi:uncharacterized protein